MTTAKMYPEDRKDPLDLLTPREREVFWAHGDEKLAGLSNSDLAKELFITENTLRKHLRQIYLKYKLIRNRSGLTFCVCQALFQR